MNTEGIKRSTRLFSVLGDSLSTLFGYSQPWDSVFYSADKAEETGVFDKEDTWWGQVVEAMKGELLVNDSISGCTVCYDPRYIEPNYGCSDFRTSSLSEEGRLPDVILVLMGLNDCGCQKKIVPTCEAEKQDLSVFSVAYGTMLRKLRAQYPEAEVWCLTLPLGKCRDGRLSSKRAERLKAYNSEIAACAVASGCRLLDIYTGCEPYESMDGLHATKQGMQVIADSVLRLIH